MTPPHDLELFNGPSSQGNRGCFRPAKKKLDWAPAETRPAKLMDWAPAESIQFELLANCNLNYGCPQFPGVPLKIAGRRPAALLAFALHTPPGSLKK